jgi:Cys-tRNA(Pro) deacylase
MKPQKIPTTSAIRALKGKGIAFEVFQYDYQPPGGTRQSARALGVTEHQVIKTLVMCNEKHHIFLMLMHGDRTVSTKAFSRKLGYKTIQTCTQEQAFKATGYRFGGTSPFGTLKPLPLYLESSILALPFIWINGGRPGLLVKIDPQILIQSFHGQVVSVALSNEGG